MSSAVVVGGLRLPFFVLAVTAAVLVVLVELGLPTLVLGGSTGRDLAESATELGIDADALAGASSGVPQPPGVGIGALALLDGLLLFSLLMLGLSLLMPLRVYGRLQGVATLVVSLLWVLMCLMAALAALSALMLMIGLFVAVPFGTLAYLAIWGSFPTGQAATVLGLLLFLKLCLGAFLILAQPRFLLVKGLMVLMALSFVVQLFLGFIQGFLPGPVVAIGDTLWAVVTAVVSLVWALVMLIFSIPAIINAVRSVRAAAD